MQSVNTSAGRCHQKRNSEADTGGYHVCVMDKLRTLKAKQGVWAVSKKYAVHLISEDGGDVALSLCLEDEMECSLQGCNKKDMVHVLDDGKREPVSK